MERWEGKVAVITGASAGMGAAFAKALVQKGLKVAGLARRIDRLQDLATSLCYAPGKLYPFRCDVSNEEAVLKTFKQICEMIGPIHILINNAGLTRPTNLVDGATEEWRRIFDVNVLALCVCTREAVKVMREKNIAGHIIHINSVAGHYVPSLPEPDFNVYPASKFAVTALTESLRQELRYHKCGIKVTSVSPGVVRTEFQEGLPQNGTQEALKEMPALKPEDVAEAVVYILSTPPHVQIHELTVRPLGEMF